MRWNKSKQTKLPPEPEVRKSQFAGGDHVVLRRRAEFGDGSHVEPGAMGLIMEITEPDIYEIWLEADREGNERGFIRGIPSSFIRLVEAPPSLTQVLMSQSQHGIEMLAAMEAEREGVGFAEGTRVKLSKPFWGKYNPELDAFMRDWDVSANDAPSHPAGSTGTIIYPDDASPELIADMRINGKYIVAMDNNTELYSGGPFPGVEGAALERIPGRDLIHRTNERNNRQPVFDVGNRVAIKSGHSSKSTGVSLKAGQQGVISPGAGMIAECWRTNFYPVMFDRDSDGNEPGIVTIAFEALELVMD